MGPPRAAEILREALYRGADQVILVTDRKTAGSDTLATSYVLRCAVERLAADFGDYDLVFCGRQAIDGDTAQVGPQVAEKARHSTDHLRRIDRIAAEAARLSFTLTPSGDRNRTLHPALLLTVVGSANQPRPPSIRRMLEYKLAATHLEYPSLLRKVARVCE